MTDHAYLWTKRDGTQVDVRAMKHDHLRNALRLLHRAAIVKETVVLAGMPDADINPMPTETATALVLRHYPEKGRVLVDEWSRREVDRPETDYRPDSWASGDPKLGPLLGDLLTVALGKP